MNNLDVVIIGINVGKTLAACIKSVLKQRGNFKFEIVYIDSVSCDNSFSIANSLKINKF